VSKCVTETLTSVIICQTTSFFHSRTKAILTFHVLDVPRMVIGHLSLSTLAYLLGAQYPTTYLRDTFLRISVFLSKLSPACMPITSALRAVDNVLYRFMFSNLKSSKRVRNRLLIPVLTHYEQHRDSLCADFCLAC